MTASEQNGAAKKSITITGESGKLSEEDIERVGTTANYVYKCSSL